MISDMWWKSSNLRKKIEKVLKELFHKEMTCKIFRIITAPYLTEPYTNAKIEKNHEQWIIPSNSTPAYLAIISLVRQGFLIFSIPHLVLTFLTQHAPNLTQTNVCEEKSSLSKTFSFRNFRNNCLTIIFYSYQVNKYSKLELLSGPINEYSTKWSVKKVEIDFRAKIEILYWICFDAF